MKRVELCLAVLGLTLSGCGLMPMEVERSERVGMDAAELLMVSDRVADMTGAEAERWQQGLSRRGGAEVEIKLATLALYGPPALRDPERAHQRLAAMLAEPERFRHDSSRRLVRLMADDARRRQGLAGRVDGLTRDLAAERLEHAETRRKLEALRRIEQELGARGGRDNSDAGESGGQSDGG